jgi:hypothetical protein
MVNKNIDIFEMSYEEIRVIFQAFGELGEDQAHKRSQSFLPVNNKHM